jgi:hypothetical protein
VKGVRPIRVRLELADASAKPPHRVRDADRIAASCRSSAAGDF